MSKWAADNAEGLHAYVVTTSEWGGTRVWTRIVYAESLSIAKSQHGWTRMQHTTKAVRRAVADDLPGASGVQQ